MKKAKKFVTIILLVLGCTLILISINIKVPKKTGNNTVDKMIKENVSSNKRVFLSLGIMFTIFGGTLFLIEKISDIYKKKLRETGFRIDAKIETIQKLTNSDSAIYYVLTCYYLDPMSGEKHVFKTNPILFNIAILVEAYNIKTVPVYLKSSNNYNNYFIDIDEFQMYDNRIN